MSHEPYFLAVQTNTFQTVEAAGVPIMVWTSEAFPTTIQAADAIATFCGHDPQTIERSGFIILEISPPPK